MLLPIILEEKNMSVYQCSQISGIPYTTLLELVRGKSVIEKCAGETIFRLASALNMSMDELYEALRCPVPLPSFEAFKSNVCHIVKTKGDLEYIIEMLETDEVNRYWEQRRYLEAYYTLAMVDYLSREHGLPLCNKYDSIRSTSLKETVYPRDIELAARLDPSLDVKAQAVAESIPEFIRFNIVEKEIRDVC